MHLIKGLGKYEQRTFLAQIVGKQSGSRMLGHEKRFSKKVTVPQHVRVTH